MNVGTEMLGMSFCVVLLLKKIYDFPQLESRFYTELTGTYNNIRNHYSVSKLK